MQNSGQHGQKSDEKQKGWSWLKPAIAAAIVALAAYLLYRTLSRYDLDELIASIGAVPAGRLLAAVGWAAASYLCLTGFDFLATRYVGHPLPYRYVALASFTSLSIGHNLGFAALSSGAVRYRFYSRAGLSTEEVAKVIVFCGVTVGLGLLTLAGIALLLRPETAVEITRLNQASVLAAGIACLAASATYVLLSAVVRRPFHIWRWSIELPRPAIALAQIGIGTLNFGCVAACLHAVISSVGDVSYPAVASVYVLATVATLVTHVPGGLGVIESVVLLLLDDRSLIGAVLVFRFVYFLLPLGLGAALLALVELKGALIGPVGEPARK